MDFNLFEKSDLDQLVTLRDGELKIGSKMQVGSALELTQLKESTAKYVVLGIPEDAGPRANCGRAGAETAWEAFLPKFVNLQQTKYLNGKEVLLLGHFNFQSIENYASSDLSKLRKVVEMMDDAVYATIEMIVGAGKIPIVIGGGHNNSFGLLKGASLGLNQSINCINLDPHADYRALEGRHSGNGFSYAKAEGLLNKYAIVGLHENYNSQEMLDRMEQDLIDYSTFEAIFLREEIGFEDAVDSGLNFVSKSHFGVELDCDSIQDFPSSAQTPSGISANQARFYVHHAALHPNSIYLHLPEAAPSLVPGSSEQVGKLLAYLVSDFIRAKS